MRLSVSISILFLLNFFITFSLLGQNNEHTKKVYDYNSIFVHYPNIDSIEVDFNNFEPQFLTLYIHTDLNHKISRKENYDLAFLGDEYLLKKRYKDLLPFIYGIKMDSLDNLVQKNKSTQRIVFTRTSFKCHAITPKYILSAFCDVASLQKKLQDAWIEINKGVVGDSVIILQGIIERDKTLGHIDLIDGEISSFSNFILHCLKNSSRTGVWFPMTNSSGMPLRSLIDIYVKLSTNGSILITTSGSLRSLKINDSGKNGKLYF